MNAQEAVKAVDTTLASAEKATRVQPWEVGMEQLTVRVNETVEPYLRKFIKDGCEATPPKEVNGRICINLALAYMLAHVWLQADGTPYIPADVYEGIDVTASKKAGGGNAYAREKARADLEAAKVQQLFELAKARGIDLDELNAILNPIEAGAV